MTGDRRTPEQRKRSILAEILSAGIVFPVAVLLGGALGRWFDRRFETEPIGLLIGVLLGLGAALVPIFRASAAWDRAESDQGSATPPSPPDESGPRPPAE